MIDHTLLKANATKAEILQVCEEARKYRTASVCVNSYWAATVSGALKGSGVMTCCVVGFPLGAMSTEAKAFETQKAVEDGAEEIDMVINVGLARANDWEALEADIAAVVKAAGSAKVKVIIETCLLTDEEKVKACMASKNAGAAFVKTSTGFSTAGATVEDVKLMRETVGPEMGVKAAGGIRTRQTALAMIEAGANRVGASATSKLVEE
ncbi:MAG: deoxyribose-phosphate aldolase [Clostridiales bacterium]|nr:deoxyribose-phosphate aldolase [Clostridiales bacterium]MDO4349811.1 deoxyribose-phosphate aldolase [Eubacteriales bacterium]MDY4007407.1 deoxyribose-phosphate aldolase [Candidatus Limiplasma sp.]